MSSSVAYVVRFLHDINKKNNVGLVEITGKCQGLVSVIKQQKSFVCTEIGQWATRWKHTQKDGHIILYVASCYSSK